VFQQQRGVSMGGNASPDIANLTLSIMEFEFCKTASKDIQSELANSVISRYIDDIWTANCPNFEKWTKDIYGTSLKLDKSQTKNGRIPFLDLSIATGGRHDRINVYDKTDDFAFTVLKYGFADSNVSRRSGLQVLITQLIRFARITSTLTDFKRRTEDICYIMRKQGYTANEITVNLGKFYGKYPQLLTKFHILSKLEFIQCFDQLLTKLPA
jgi:hypothetical protein